jgi:trehalose 6-phosphate phosphatase
MADAATGPDDRPYALFLDFDGTLVEIVDRPDAVIVAPDLSPTLASLRERLDGALAIVTGRQIAVVDAHLGPLGLDVAGLHGAERRLRGDLHAVRIEDHPELGRAIERLKTFATARPGLIVEDKIGSVALHWRLAPENEDEALTYLGTVLTDMGEAWRLQQGKLVAEIVPASAAKGTAILDLLEEAPYRGRRPVFIGDDLTDEAGFAVVNERGGVSVRVGEGKTRAHYRMRDAGMVRTFLAHWAQAGAPDFERAVAGGENSP